MARRAKMIQAVGMTLAAAANKATQQADVALAVFTTCGAGRSSGKTEFLIQTTNCHAGFLTKVLMHLLLDRPEEVAAAAADAGP